MNEQHSSWAQQGDFRIEHRPGIWSAQVFSDVVAVSNPGRVLYFSGMGPEDEADGHIRYPGDFVAQCRYSYEKIGRLLHAYDATFANVVKVTTYSLESEYRDASTRCRREAFEGVKLPAHTFLAVKGFAWPEMLVELDVVAVLDR